MDERADLSYEIYYTKAADKFLKTHEDVRTQYEDAIRELLVGDHPENVDVKRIRGKRNDYYRIRLGGYRVVYAIINGKIVVISTLLAGARSDVYKKMSGLK
ncbi:MAG: type II toxin-antitoxin system RelE/ParE family toxin [Eubacteriales bacterium]|nr:type II toxin-antitoxin system RelE/ParE family toxin [Eubacteriales bacterium]